MASRTVKTKLPEAEATDVWPAQGQWTYEDYLRLPNDGRRYEIIEGILYVANAPAYDHQYTVMKLAGRFDQFVSDATTYDHQYTISELHGELRAFVKERQLGVVLTAPFEVHLPGIARPVQPDILFIPAARQPQADAQIFEGTPNLIVEVLSPSSIRLDNHIKLGAYEQAGVQEYWIADPKTQSVTIYILPEGGQEYVLHGQFGSADTLTSKILAGLELSVAPLFAAENM
jgi:Uma2 family endonuclease